MVFYSEKLRKISLDTFIMICCYFTGESSANFFSLCYDEFSILVIFIYDDTVVFITQIIQ